MTNEQVIAKGGGSPQYRDDHSDCPICNPVDELDENFSHCEFCGCLIRDDTKKKVYCDGMVACEDCYDQKEDEEIKKMQREVEDITAAHQPPREKL